MIRHFLGTTTTEQFLDGLHFGLYRNVVSVVVTSDCSYAMGIQESVERLGIEESVFLASFDDVADVACPGAIDEEEARAIYEFLISHDGEGVEYLFACDGSVSRSSAMLCAWMRLCGEDDLSIWVDAANYAPNVLVYSRVLAAGGVQLTRANVRDRELLKKLSFARMIVGRRVHTMHLLGEPWDKIANGAKRCELRRLDAKRKGVSAGDLVVFSRIGSPDDIVAADVRECRTAASFEELLRDEGVVSASGFRTAKEALAELEGIYGEDSCPVVALFLDTSCWAHGRDE